MPSSFFKTLPCALAGVALFSYAFFFGQAPRAFAATVLSNEVKVFVRPAVTCAASLLPTLNQNVTWQARIEPTEPPSASYYTYRWSGADNLSGNSASVAKKYAAPGAKNATVSVRPKLSAAPDLQVSAECETSVPGPPPPTLPDLTAHTPTLSGLTEIRPGVFKEGVATLQGTASNIGAADAPGTFKNKYCFALSPAPLAQCFFMRNAGNTADLEFQLTDTVSPLTQNKQTDPNRGMNRGVAPYTWRIGPGTWYFRLCADNPSRIAESREDNNCSAALGPITVDSTFTSITRFLLEASVEGSGSIVSADNKISCTASSASCKALYDEGETVLLTAAPDTGWRLKEWGGVCSGTQAETCQVIMNKDKTVTASFGRGGRGGRHPGESPRGSCAASPTSVRVNQAVTWTANPDEDFGTPPYTIKWIGDAELQAACAALNVCTPPSSLPLNYGAPYAITVSYADTDPEKKAGVVRMTDLEGQSAEISCSTEVTVAPQPPPTSTTPGFTLEADPKVITLQLPKSGGAAVSQTSRLFITPGLNYKGVPKISSIRLQSADEKLVVQAPSMEIADDSSQFSLSLTGKNKSYRLTPKVAELCATQPCTRVFKKEFQHEQGKYGKERGIDFFVETQEAIPLGTYTFTFTAKSNPEDDETVTLTVVEGGEGTEVPGGEPVPGQPVRPRFEEF
ncbi:MAG: hypothetical protein Greene041679_559 [Parcubacteria group bacterium Greene0416_79]|nr:MAG: hypothetical protein Greene041679_559 [Parcubacteria group bacterium Greene0416_79]